MFSFVLSNVIKLMFNFLVFIILRIIVFLFLVVKSFIMCLCGCNIVFVV